MSGVVNSQVAERSNPTAAIQPISAIDRGRPVWYAVYTAPRHEKRVSQQLTTLAIDHLLPLYDTVHRWKNKRAKLQLPLFPNYLFVHVAREERIRVLRVPGVKHLVHRGGQPVPVRDEDMLALGRILSSKPAMPHPFLTVGKRVRVRSGPFAGAEGVLVRSRNNLRFVLSINIIQSAVAVEIDAIDLEPLAPSHRPN